MKPKFFPNPKKLREWFKSNHERKSEQWIGYYKKATGKPSITWPESVDQALCFGWIDGIRKSIDDQSYMIRFTPRRPKSNWSQVNLKRIKELKKQGLVQTAGEAAYQRRDQEKIRQYAYEKNKLKLPPEYTKQLKQDSIAWEFFESLPKSVKQPTISWLVTAKKEETRKRRFEQLIDYCRRQQRLPQFLSPAAKQTAANNINPSQQKKSPAKKAARKKK